MTKRLLSRVDHRPFPIPSTAWVMTQEWDHLLFAHWPISAAVLRDLIPNSLEVDLFDGVAWIGVVPFAMRQVFPRYTFAVPWLSNFLELNVRTYVSMNGIPGVFFFSLDCSNPVAVQIARKLYHLPYYDARMAMVITDETVNYTSKRAHSEAAFEACYRAVGPVESSSSGSIESFLTERYCLYSCNRAGKIYRGVIHHDRWPLQRAEAEIRKNTLVSAELRIDLPDTQPILHYSRHLETIEWAISAVV